MEKEQFGKFIAQCRKEQNLTQAELAKKLHVTNKAVSRWENGYGFPDMSLLEPLADALQISIGELMESKRVTHGKTSFPTKRFHMLLKGLAVMIFIIFCAFINDRTIQQPRDFFMNGTITITGIDGKGKIQPEFHTAFPSTISHFTYDINPKENVHLGDTVHLTFHYNKQTYERTLVASDLAYQDYETLKKISLPNEITNQKPSAVLVHHADDGDEMIVVVKETNQTYTSLHYDHLYFQDGNLVSINDSNGSNPYINSFLEPSLTTYAMEEMDSFLVEKTNLGWYLRANEKTQNASFHISDSGNN